MRIRTVVVVLIILYGSFVGSCSLRRAAIRNDPVLTLEKKLTKAKTPEKREAIEHIQRLCKEYKRYYYPIFDCVDIILNAKRNVVITEKITEYCISEGSGTIFYVELAGYAAKARLADEEFLILAEFVKNCDIGKLNKKAVELARLASKAGTDAKRREVREKIDALNNSVIAFLWPGRELVESYAAFLSQSHTEPVDYVMQLFESHDIVVLCERMHTESTQWDLIFEIVSDDRFIQSVGTIFTEYGLVNLQPYLERFLNTNDLSEIEIEERVVNIMRNLSIWPVCPNTNFYKYLKKLYALNQSLPESDRINHYFSDIKLDWEGMTAAKYNALRKSVFLRRDKVMADRIETKVRDILASAHSRKKCLVIMNNRHAFGPILDSNGELLGNTCEYLFEAFPERVANVLINTVAYDVDRNEIPTSGGKWDAAFKMQGDPDTGFDFDGSPFGDDSFDMYPVPWISEKYKYKDVFTGFIFYKPLNQHLLEQGFPGLLDGFEETALQRAKCIGEDYCRQFKENVTSEFIRGQVKSRKPAYSKFY